MLLKEFFLKVNFEKKSADDNKIMKNYPACKDIANVYKMKYNILSYLT